MFQSTHTRAQGGFSLVEMAIVLVIMGLLLGATLKGQEILDSSRVRAADNDFSAISTAYYLYLDRFRRLPGDDGPLATLTARGNNWANAQAGNQDGLLTVTGNQTFNGGGEQAAFWSQLRAAGLLSGDPASNAINALPRNPWGGLTGLTTAVTNTLMGNLGGLKLCWSQVPGKAAMAMDQQWDDGMPNQGAVRATQGTAGANSDPGNAATAYSEDFVYTVCRSF